MTPTAATPVRELPRWRVTATPRTLSPYRRVDGEWITNAKPIRVRRAPGRPMALALIPRHDHAALLTAAELDFVRTIAAKRRWRLTESYTPLRIPRYSHLEGDLDCNPDLLARLNRVAIRLSKIHGRRVTIFVRSGRRTIAEQRTLWNRYRAGRGPLAAYPDPNAPHIRNGGQAADCGIDGRDIGDTPGAIGALAAEGLGLPIPGEDWHVEITDSMIGAAS